MAGDFDLSPQDYADDTPKARAPKHPQGSHRARVEGCTCPIIENAYGRGIDAGINERLFVTDPACPYHAGAHLPAPAPAEPRE